MKLLSIDPAGLTKHSGFHGYAIFNKGKLVYVDAIDFSKMSEAEQINKIQQVFIRNKGIDVVAIENQFQGLNPQTLMRLVEGRRTWEIEGIKNRCKIARIEPSKWQKAMLGKTKPRQLLKQLSVMRVKGVYKIDVNPDEADAINLGEYYLNKMRLE